MTENALLILKRDGKVLFVHRAATKANLPHKWALPSGRIEAGETPEATAVREAMEELSVSVRAESVLGSVEFPELDKRLLFVTGTTAADAEIVADPREIQATRWMTFADFFAEFGDDHIGHGLQYLRNHPELW